MSRVPLVFAGLDYWERTLPLVDERVKPEGIELQWVRQPPGALFGRMIRGEFEAGEMSASFLTLLAGQGIDTLVGIPLFTSRAFRHASIFVRTDAGIEAPEDLKGKRVGVPDYPMTSALWARGFLQHDHGVKASEIEWFQGSDDPSYNRRVSPTLPPEIKLSTMPPDKPLGEMLLNRELDAFTGPQVPRQLAGNATVRRLIPDYRQVEQEYYKRTGIFPITHMVVMRRDIYERYRWMPVNLMEAFAKAKAIGWEQMRGQLAANMPWMPEYLHELDSVFHGNPYRDGFEANRPTLDALTQYSYEQGLSHRRIEPEDLFAPETLAVEI